MFCSVSFGSLCHFCQQLTIVSNMLNEETDGASKMMKNIFRFAQMLMLEK